jgi:Uma2 family endonuclease
MSAPVETGITGLTLDDIYAFPEDKVRREIIDGELFVSPSPTVPHQLIGFNVMRCLAAYQDAHGGLALPVYNNDFSNTTHLEPDAAFVLPEHLDRVRRSGVRGAPDLVVEVSSPSTRSHDRIRKRAVYEREGVPEFWFVDLDHDCVEVYRLADGRYAEPLVVKRGEIVTSPVLPGLAVAVDEILTVPDLPD